MTKFSFDSFQASYRYKIGGAYNLGFSKLARAVADEGIEKRLKSRLTANTVQLTQIKNSGGDADTVNKQLGQTRLSYLRTATQSLYDARLTSTRLTDFRSAINTMTKDLETAVNDYLKSGTRTESEDTNFKQNADYILRKLNSMYTVIKGRSAAEGARFDINMYQANRRIDSLRNILSNFPAAGAAAPAAAPVEGGDDGSISGTTAATGGTLDVTA